MKPPFRTKSLGTKVSEGEYARLEALASAREQTISELIRAVLLEEIGGWPTQAHRILSKEIIPEGGRVAQPSTSDLE